MLAGKPTFECEDVSDTLASVLKSEPDWNALPREVPAPIRMLLRHCLDKDRRGASATSRLCSTSWMNRWVQSRRTPARTLSDGGVSCRGLWLGRSARDW